MQKRGGHLKVFRRRDDAPYISSPNQHQRVNKHANLLPFPPLFPNVPSTYLSAGRAITNCFSKLDQS